MSMRPIPVTCDGCGIAFHTGTLRLGAQFCFVCEAKHQLKKEMEQRGADSIAQAEFEAQCDGAGGDQALNSLENNGSK
jgi:hypothetical protein